MSRARSRTPARVAGAALGLALLLGAAGAGAQGRFERYVSQAQAAYQRGDAEAAIRALQHAYGIRPVATLLFNIARAQELAGRPASAIEYYDRFLATHPDPEQEATAEQARAAAQAVLDQRNRPQTTTAAGAGNNAGAGASGEAGAGGHVAVNPHPREVHGPRRFTAVHAGLLAGGGGLVVAGGVFGALALVAQGQLGGTGDPTQLAGIQGRGQAFAWTANVGIGLGVVAAAVGAILYLTQDTRVPAPPAGDATATAGAGGPEAR
jgi:tetratricopeptide (TPR) repeat protein